MKRILILTAAVVATVILSAAPTQARAASCSVSAKGGVKAPFVLFDGSVNESGPQGYKCTVAWDADVVPQYESGGTWHLDPMLAPSFHPNTPDQFQPANVAFNWTAEDGVAWFPSASPDTPACSVNWRLQVNFFGTNHFVFQSDVSPQTNKTC